MSQNKRESLCPYSDALVLVLVQDEYVEPAVRVLQWPLELDGLLLEGKVQPLVLDVADPIQSDPSLSPLEQHWHYVDLLHVLHFSKVVEVVVDASLVETGEHVEASGVVMIPVDAEDRQSHAQRTVRIVRLRILKRLKFLPLAALVRFPLLLALLALL